MNIAKGARLVRVNDVDTAPNTIQVTAVRYGPVPYAEVRPYGGGRCRAVLLTDLERDFRPESDATVPDE